MSDAVQNSPRPAILLLGMHRSGASALSRVFSNLGYAQPDDAVHGRAERRDDPGEPNAILQLNDRIFKDLSASWDDPRLLVARGQPIREGAAAAQLALRAKYLPDAVRAVAASFNGRDRIVVKDSRVSLFTELWHAAFVQAGYQPMHLLCYRDPVEVAQSIRAHANLFAPRVHQLWLRYNLAVLMPESRARLAGVVGYEDVLAGRGFDRLLEKLGIDGNALRAASGSVDEAARHFSVPMESTLSGSMLAGATKMLFAALTGWNNDDPAQRRDRIEQAMLAFDEFSLLAGSVIAVAPNRPAAPPKPVAAPVPVPAEAPPAPKGPRPVLIHYHLFKNAGTSLDRILRESFGARWISREFAGPLAAEHQRELAALLEENGELVALSSHTLLLPPPKIENLSVLPVLFVRHPIDRLRSAYAFEKAQKAETVGAALARDNDFAGYIRKRLDTPGETFCRNFQVHRLAAAHFDPNLSPTDRAMAAIEDLPFVGLVEAFEPSMARLNEIAVKLWPEFRLMKVHANATAPDTTLQQRLHAVRKDIDEDLYDELLAANRGDMDVWNIVRARYREN